MAFPLSLWRWRGWSRVHHRHGVNRRRRVFPRQQQRQGRRDGGKLVGTGAIEVSVGLGAIDIAIMLTIVCFITLSLPAPRKASIEREQEEDGGSE